MYRDDVFDDNVSGHCIIITCVNINGINVDDFEKDTVISITVY